MLIQDRVGDLIIQLELRAGLLIAEFGSYDENGTLFVQRAASGGRLPAGDITAVLNGLNYVLPDVRSGYMRASFGSPANNGGSLQVSTEILTDCVNVALTRDGLYQLLIPTAALRKFMIMVAAAQAYVRAG
jgi:hypothetical protein